ncbi:cation transporter [Flavivirga algicola]|uniref:Heavy-metal-associated domain-containing protein n=1 Tax=Flavivirga algicola TaxID=2729136 RepID=A0ABX1RTV1_9FLAO|nr:heavy metal-associated domain-containing protein [Flavivirga algicola]NMH86966.1 heavy-metal-associated domain-containing protein [Flavivirga algicola]
MNALKNIIAFAIVALVTVSCKNETKPEVKTIEVATESAKELDPNATYAKAEFTIEGMTCAIGCAKTIEKKIAKMEGVKSATVDFDRKLAMVEYNEAKVTPISLEETVTNVADIYKVSDMKTVEGFSTKKTCKADCTKTCCVGKTDAEKKTCAADCKKTCCTEKVQA